MTDPASAIVLVLVIPVQVDRASVTVLVLVIPVQVDPASVTVPASATDQASATDREVQAPGIDREVQALGIDREGQAPGMVREESPRRAVASIRNVESTGGRTSGGRFVRTPRDCRHSVRPSGAVIRVGVGAGPGIAAIGGAGPRGRP